MRKLTVAVAVVVIAMLFSSCAPSSAEVDEVRACWVSTIGNLDFPSKVGMSSKTLKKEIDEIVINCSQLGLNTIFFQVRPKGDALYDSSIFPWSEYLSGVQGVAPDNRFDPLDYFVKSAHGAGIELHAWINPYRVGSSVAELAELSRDNPARLHTEYMVVTSSGIYYNPGLPEVRRLILDGISEIVRNYEVDGIHLDDYFYPYDMEGFDDSAAYNLYGNGMSLEDFRRCSVDTLIKSAYTLVKTLDETRVFGVSPFGIWANKSEHQAGSETKGLSSYFDIYSDSKKWVEQGWVDYICPQIYWSGENEIAPFQVIVDWWDALCVKNDVDLYVGLAVYKVGTEEIGWGSGAVIGDQLAYIGSKQSCAGHSFFRYGILMQNPLETLKYIREYYTLN